MGFRRDVEEAADIAPSPVRPTEFPAVVTRTIESKARDLGETTLEDINRAPREEIEAVSATVAADARHALESLRRSQPGRVHAVLSALEYPDA